MKYATLLLLIFFGFVCLAQSSDDAYTRYELLEPATQSFRIYFDVTVTEPGTEFYYNTLRKGSEHKVDAVTDRATGRALAWKIVSGTEAQKAGFRQAAADVDYLQVQLAKKIVQGMEYRLLIDKTYKDPATYFEKDGRIVFDRSLGVKRNAVVLPRGYELIRCNYPSQVVLEPDGRIKVSFLNHGPAEVPLHLEGRRLAATASLAVVTAQPATPGTGQGRDKSNARVDFTFSERASQTREIVYFLQQPSTNSFRLYHDYTETREGTDRYINVVRPGSKASNPSAKILDTGTPLKVETLRGEAIKERGIDIGEPVTSDTEIVAIWFDPVARGQSVRLRIEETYTDPSRYVVHRDELVFDRSLGRPFNTVVMPEGWWLTANYVPATVDITPEGLISLYYCNGSPDEIDVLIRGRKR